MLRVKYNLGMAAEYSKDRIARIAKYSKNQTVELGQDKTGEF
jgi:hypothetical protein